MNKETTTNIHWSENVIIVDADYVDSVAFNLIVNFERMIGRRIPQADMARWVDCVALDGGVREGDNEVQVVLIHGKNRKKMDNFAPSDFETELNGKAFKDSLGEFTLSSFPIEDIVSADDFLTNIIDTLTAQPAVKRIMIIPNADNSATYDKLTQALRYAPDEKRITVFAMQPMPGGNFRQEILGYSLMNALGIKSEELDQAR
jgi:hypothetical protein